MSAGRLQQLLAAGRFVVTAEAGPPRGARPEVIRRKAALLRGKVDACNVTDNQTSVVRMCSLAACGILLGEGLEPVLQMTCRDRNRIALQSDILGAASLGIKNILCLSGDHQRFGDHPGAKNVFDLDSVQLVQVARRLRDEGLFAGGKPVDGKPELFIGAVENPFADPFSIRVPRLAKKIAAGAQFIQTQCVFNLEKFAKWMEGVRARGLHERVAILAGVTPMKSLGAARYMAEKVAGMDVPTEIIKRIEGADKSRRAEEGIALAAETVQRLQDIPGVRGVHLMAIEWEEAVPEILSRAGLLPRPSS